MRRNRNTLQVSYSEFQELQRNFPKSLHGKNLLKDKQPKSGNDEGDNKRIIFITLFISDNRGRDIDGMATTILDCLTRSGKIKDDKRQIVSMLIADYELCGKGNEGFRVRIIKM